ncbi:MAG: hypothetical protein AAGB19_06435, partial [Cyanobacteria bacterium P01_F01_bin.3]
MGSSNTADNGADDRANDGNNESAAYDLPIDADTRTTVLGAIAQKLEAEYAFPEVAQEIWSDIQNRIEADGYQDVKSGAQLAATLTAQLQTL